MTVHADDEVTLGEVSRNLAALGQSIDNRFAELNTRLDNMGSTFVRGDVYQAQRADDLRRIKNLEDSLQWTRRQVVAAVLTVIIPAAIYLVAKGLTT